MFYFTCNHGLTLLFLCSLSAFIVIVLEPEWHEHLKPRTTRHLPLRWRILDFCKGPNRLIAEAARKSRWWRRRRRWSVERACPPPPTIGEAGWPLFWKIWKTWKCQRIWQLSGKSQEITKTQGIVREKISSGKTQLFTVNIMFGATPVFFSIASAWCFW